MSRRLYQQGDVIGRIELLELLPVQLGRARLWRVRCLNCGEIMERTSSQIPRLTNGKNGELCGHNGKNKVKRQVLTDDAEYPCSKCIAVTNAKCANFRDCKRFRAWSKKAWNEAVQMLRKDKPDVGS